MKQPRISGGQDAAASNRLGSRGRWLALAVWAAIALAVAPAARAATFVVTTIADTVDATPGNGVCADSGGQCSLRAAISEANALAGADTITLPAGTYLLTRAGAKEDANVTGDLDLTGSVNLTGGGAASTIIDAGQLDRVLQVFGGASVTVSGVTLRNGRTPNGTMPECWGGGIHNHGALTLTGAVVSGNASAGNDGNKGCSGGGLFSDATLTVVDSTIASNVTGDATYGGDGGGLHLWGGTAVIRTSTITGNATGNGSAYNEDGDGGGVFTNGGSITVESSTLSGNAARGHGGGMYNYSTSAAVTLRHTTITGNTADSDRDGPGVSQGGGLTWRFGGGFVVQSSLIAGNTDQGASSADDCLGDDSYYSSNGYNLVGAGTGCPVNGTSDRTTSDARLGPLQDNGGPTRTHAVFFDSPAAEVIPSGTNGCGTTFTTDQRGAVRPGGGLCDVGAYESPYIFWDGGGPDFNTSTAANWSGDVVPATTDVPVFSLASSKNATVDTSLTVAGWLIDASYHGTIAQGGAT